MSWLSQQINGKDRGVIRVPVNDDGSPHIIDEPVELRCAVEVEAGAAIQVGHRITMRDGASWLGVGAPHTIIKQGSDHLFYLAGSEQSIGGLVTDESESSGGYSFMIDTSQSREHLRISKVRTNKSMGLIADNGLPGLIVNFHLDDVMSKAHRGRGSYLTRAFAYTTLRNCTVDYVGTNTNVPAWSFFNCEGLLLDYVDMTGTAINGNAASQWGFYFDNVRALTIKQAMADNAGGFGFYFKNCGWVDASILKASMCGGTGLVVADRTRALRFDLLYLSGRVGLPANLGSPLMWADSSVGNFHASQFLAERHGEIHGGMSSSKFSCSKMNV